MKVVPGADVDAQLGVKAAAVLITALLLAGCGGSAGSAGAGSDTAHVASAAAVASSGGSDADARAVERVVADSFFGAVSRLDSAGIARTLTPSFELDEDTTRMSGSQFLAYVHSFAGKASIQYRFDGFNTRVNGASAWTSYRNHGTFTPTGGKATPVEWAETAVLMRTPSGGWQLDRLQSMTLPSPK